MQLTDELEVHRAILAASLGGICLATCLLDAHPALRGPLAPSETNQDRWIMSPIARND